MASKKDQPEEPATTQVEQSPAPVVQSDTPPAPAEAVPGWTFSAEDEQPAPHEYPSHLEWTSTAPTAVAGSRSPMWYVGVVAAGLVVLSVAYFLTRDWVTMIAAVVIAAIFLFGISRSPKAIEYRLDAQGITVGRRQYVYSAFKSFSIFEEGEDHSLLLTPLKRYIPPLSLHCPAHMLDDAADVLGAYLPYEMREPDSIDQIARRLRF